MGLKRAIFLICLLTAPLAGASAQEAAPPATPQLTQPKFAKPKTVKTKAAALVSPRCPRGQKQGDPVCSSDLPTLSQSDHGRAGGRTPNLIFNEAPKHPLPFQNDLTPKNTPRGGLLGLEFPL